MGIGTSYGVWICVFVCVSFSVLSYYLLIVIGFNKFLHITAFILLWKTILDMIDFKTYETNKWRT